MLKWMASRAKVVRSPPTLVRYKRTTKLAPGAARIINMLSVFSARKKQPRRLKLSIEDKLRHEVVESAWRLHQRDEKLATEARLKGQYELVKEACEELKMIDPALYDKATAREVGKRFSLELRVPTETPPTKVWDFEWTPKK